MLLSDATNKSEEAVTQAVRQQRETRQTETERQTHRERDREREREPWGGWRIDTVITGVVTTTIITVASARRWQWAQR